MSSIWSKARSVLETLARLGVAMWVVSALASIGVQALTLDGPMTFLHLLAAGVCVVVTLAVGSFAHDVIDWLFGCEAE